MLLDITPTITRLYYSGVRIYTTDNFLDKLKFWKGLDKSEDLYTKTLLFSFLTVFHASYYPGFINHQIIKIFNISRNEVCKTVPS